jgi:hypothetical protein
MVKRYVLMESLSANLHDFLKKVSENLSLLDKKFLCDGFIGLIRKKHSSRSLWRGDFRGSKVNLVICRRFGGPDGWVQAGDIWLCRRG